VTVSRGVSDRGTVCKNGEDNCLEDPMPVGKQKFLKEVP
jgi:hypothetical protein